MITRRVVADRQPRGTPRIGRSDPMWIRHLVRNAQIESQLFTHNVDGDQWTDMCQDTMRLPDVLQLLDYTIEDMLNRPGFGIRQRAGSIRSLLGVINGHCTKSTSLLNKDLFSKRLEKLTELLPHLQVLDGFNAGRSMESRDMNGALLALHEYGVELGSDRTTQKFLQQMKYIGIRMYQLGVESEILPGLLENPKLYRSQIGTVERQHKKIQESPVSQPTDPSRMIHSFERKPSVRGKHSGEACEKKSGSIFVL